MCHVIFYKTTMSTAQTMPSGIVLAHGIFFIFLSFYPPQVKVAPGPWPKQHAEHVVYMLFRPMLYLYLFYYFTITNYYSAMSG